MKSFDPIERLWRAMGPTLALQREIDRLRESDPLRHMGTIERRALESALTEYNQIEKMKRQMLGNSVHKLAASLEKSVGTNTVRRFYESLGTLDFAIGLSKNLFAIQNKSSFAELLGTTDQRAAEMLSGYQSALLASTSVARATYAAALHLDNDRIRAIRESWDYVARFAQQASPIAAALAAAAKERVNLPLLGSAVSAEIANHWRQYGLDAELRAISERYGHLLSEEELTDKEIAEFSQDFTEWTRGKGVVDLGTFIGIVGILLTLLIWYDQDRSSAEMEHRLNTNAVQTEKRLTAKIEANQEKTDAQLKVLTALISSALEQVQPSEQGTTLFVVRARKALLRTKPEAGASIVGSLVPNQTTVLLEEKGTWIRVEFFDWHTQSARDGWVLKKYLVRVPHRLKAP